MKISALLVCACTALAASAPAFAQRMSRASVGAGGVQGNSNSFLPSISADGRFVAFHSKASNLVAGDQNGVGDVFVRDRVRRTTTLVSQSSSGAVGDHDSTDPSISPEGAFVAFLSAASNLVPGDTIGSPDIFVRDLVNGTTERVSVGPSGEQSDGLNFDPCVSAGGRFVSFSSSATNLVPGDTNGARDIFVRDVVQGTTTRVSVDANGVQGDDHSLAGAISHDGRFVVFESESTNLVPGDTNDTTDIFVKDLATGAITRVSVDSNGVQANFGSAFSSISATGRYVVFGSPATNLVPFDLNGVHDVFVHDMVAGTTTLASIAADGAQADAFTTKGTISADGRYVAFRSDATNLVPNDTNHERDVFARDLVLGLTVRVSVNAYGRQGSDESTDPVISADGRSVAFYGEADNLVPFDTNDTLDVFVAMLANAFP